MKIDAGLLKGIFLIMLTIIGTTVENTFSCQALKLLHRNTFAKQIVIICLIYFTIDFTDNKNLHPYETIQNTLFIWLCYILMSKQKLEFVIVLFICLVSLYIINSYRDYLDQQPNKDDKLIQQINTIEEYVTYGLFGIAIVGFILYFIKEKKDHKKNFKYYKFLFGSNSCEHDK